MSKSIHEYQYRRRIFISHWDATEARSMVHWDASSACYLSASVTQDRRKPGTIHRPPFLLLGTAKWVIATQLVNTSSLTISAQAFHSYAN